MTAFVFQFPAEVDSWYDGDSLSVHRQSQPGQVVHGEKVRVHGINAPELHDARGMEARDYAAGLAPPGSQVILVATKEDKYGRFLARVILPTGDSLGDLMIAGGHAVPYLL
ncbi:MAG: thermonuclease family protein [bacterium]